jgi:hypothetical protein
MKGDAKDIAKLRGYKQLLKDIRVKRKETLRLTR